MDVRVGKSILVVIATIVGVGAGVGSQLTINMGIRSTNNKQRSNRINSEEIETVSFCGLNSILKLRLNSKSP